MEESKKQKIIRENLDAGVFFCVEDDFNEGVENDISK